MQERDSFQLTYSQSLGHSKRTITHEQPDQEQQQLSPNKRSMLETLKETIMKPHPTQEVISSLTSVEPQEESAPCPQEQEPLQASQTEEIKQSLPSVRQLKKLASNLQEDQPSKVKGSYPRSVSQKASLNRQIAEATEFLAQGIEVQKYCYGAEKVENTILYFSEDVSFMGLYHIVKQNFIILPMCDCSAIIVGPKTQRFQFYTTNEYKIPEDQCFSLIFKERSYDFLTKSRECRDRVISALNFLREGPPSPPSHD